jgi:hypothetical protein
MIPVRRHFANVPDATGIARPNMPAARPAWYNDRSGLSIVPEVYGYNESGSSGLHWKGFEHTDPNFAAERPLKTLVNARIISTMKT